MPVAGQHDRNKIIEKSGPWRDREMCICDYVICDYVFG
jgi:hypothetical protein